jgi:hypothetical protein
MDRWQTKRILILGTTYPSYSKKYTETVCTGGLEDETFRMVRLHPVPYRYLDEGKSFHAFQWIRVNVRQHPNDPRPESLGIDPDSIVLEEQVPPGQDDVRRGYLERSPHFVKSVEELKDRQKATSTSLGIVKPARISGCRVQRKSPNEREEWVEKEKEILAQGRLFGDEAKALDFPEAEFRVQWECDDPRCQGHDMGILQWGLHELYRKLARDPERDDKVVKKMESQLNQKKKDVFLFLGSFRDHMYNFGLMDSYSAPKVVQGRLFG